MTCAISWPKFCNTEGSMYELGDGISMEEMVSAIKIT